MHASFTLSDATIEECVGIAREFGVGCHIQLAEDAADRRFPRQYRYLRQSLQQARMTVSSPFCPLRSH